MNQINKPKKGFSLLQMHSQPTNYDIRKCHLLMTYENSKTGSPSSLSFVDAINFWENPELHIIYIKVCCKFPTILSYDTRHNLQNNYSVWSLSEVAAAVREAPLKKLQGLFGHCPNGEGGSKRLPEWFGALILRRIVHVQRGICLVWGVWTLARMVWGTYAVKIEVQMAFAQVGPEIKCPRVPVWVKGGEGGAIAIWAMPE